MSFLNAVQLVALGGLILFAFAVFVGAWLEERRHGYRLSYERHTPEPPRVTLCPYDQDASS